MSKRMRNNDLQRELKWQLWIGNMEYSIAYQLKLSLSEVNNRETIAATEVNNDTYCLQNRIEKFLLSQRFPMIVSQN